MIHSNALVLLAVFLCCLSPAFAGDQPSTKDLALDECVSVALSQNPRILSATQRVVGARERVAGRQAVKLPQIEFRAEAMKYDWLPANKRNILGGTTTDVYSALNLSLLLFSNGRADAAIDSATAQLYASAEELRRTTQDVAFDVIKSYYNVLRLEAILSTREEAAKQMEHYLVVAREKQNIGKAPKLDVLRAEVQLADVTQSRLLALSQLEISRLELLNAMGIPDDGVVVNPIKDDIPAAQFAEYDQFVEEAFMINPEYLRAQHLTEVAEKDVRVARAEFGPNLGLVASYNREGSDFPDISNWNAGLVLSMPIFDAGRTGAKVGEARAILEQNKSTLELISQRIRLAIRSAVLSTQDSANRLIATRKSLEQAQEALSIAQEKYAVGMGSTTEVIDTQVALVQARTNYAQALYDGKVAVAALELAVGRDPAPKKKTVRNAEGLDEL